VGKQDGKKRFGLPVMLLKLEEGPFYNYQQWTHYETVQFFLTLNYKKHSLLNCGSNLW
jgi:hypothetical protein